MSLPIGQTVANRALRTASPPVGDLTADTLKLKTPLSRGLFRLKVVVVIAKPGQHSVALDDLDKRVESLQRSTATQFEKAHRRLPQKEA